jgi:phage-related tail fiber protein
MPHSRNRTVTVRIVTPSTPLAAVNLRIDGDVVSIFTKQQLVATGGRS